MTTVPGQPFRRWRAHAHNPWLNTIATNGLNLLLGLLTGVLAARLLQPEGRGELAEVLFWSGLVAALGILGLPSAVTYHLAHKRRPHEIVPSALAVLALLIPASILVGGVVILELAAPELRWLILGYTTLFVPVNFLSLTLMAVDHGRQRFLRYNLDRLLPAAIYLVGLIGLWLAGAVNVPAVLAAVWAGTCAILLPRLRRGGSWAAGSVRWQRGVELVRSGLRLHATLIVAVLFQQTDRAYLVLLGDQAALGLYVVASTLSAAALGVVTTAFETVIFPRLAAQGGEAGRSREVDRTLLAALAAAVLINGGIMLVTPLVVPLLFGAAFAGAVPAAIILALAQIPGSYVGVAAAALRGLGDWRAGPIAQGLGLLVLLVALPLLSRLMGQGVMPVALGLLLAQLGAALAIGWQVRRHGALTRAGLAVGLADLLSLLRAPLGPPAGARLGDLP